MCKYSSFEHDSMTLVMTGSKSVIDNYQYNVMDASCTREMFSYPKFALSLYVIHENTSRLIVMRLRGCVQCTFHLTETRAAHFQTLTPDVPMLRPNPVTSEFGGTQEIGRETCQTLPGLHHTQRGSGPALSRVAGAPED